MADYNAKAKSFIAGLSDFWLKYFKEIDQIQELYKGQEILVGQSYLDLMALLLNNSVQDTLIFNKEFFKLLLIRENDIRFKAGAAAATDRYVYTLPDNVAYIRHMNNRIFMATESLDDDVEFYVDDAARAVEFKFDPLNAYLETTFGTDNGALLLRTRLRGEDAPLVRVWLNDTGAPLSIGTVGYDVTITYDGPANTNTTTAAAIVAGINTNPLAGGLLFADLAGLGTGTASPPGTVALASLNLVDVNPLDFYAVRTVSVAFEGKLTTPTIPNWVDAGVKKGDILRLISGRTVGSAQNVEINLVRPDALYVVTDSNNNDVDDTRTLLATAGKHIDFAVLRTPASPASTNEPLPNSGVITQSGVDGSVTAATRQFNAPSANFSPVHIGEVIELLGVLNLGYARIIDWINPNTVVIGLLTAVDEAPLAWNLLTVMDPANINTDGVLVNNGDGTGTFTAPSATFDIVPTPAVGTVVEIYRGGALERFEVTGIVGVGPSTTCNIKIAPTVASDPGPLVWGWARFFTPTGPVLFSPPAAWVDGGSLTVSAKRELDERAVQPGIDYTVNYETGIIVPLTVWRPAADNTCSYTYKLAVVENLTPLQSGVDGTILAGSPATFSSPTAVFNSTHVGAAIQLANSGLVPATNNGTFFIASVVSTTQVTLSTDRVVPAAVDPNNGALTWSLLTRGTLATDVTTTVEELGLWCPDALVDKFHLYNTYGYLISRYERSSEEYRALIRGVFQLFMLGPTLERFESAINIVGGLPVIRDNGEILLTYDSGAEFSASDGFLAFATREFTSASYTFTFADLGKYIYIVDGFNTNKLFRILSLVGPNTVLLEEFPTTDGPVSWELTGTNKQTVHTSRTEYVFERAVPLREAVTNPVNFGSKIFKAFEVLTDVFTVTDYVETPTWWESAQIPLELMPNQSSARRQSSPQLFENVVTPSDDGRIGDPGFYIGADSDGVVPPVSVVRLGALDGTLVNDPHYPYTNNVFFNTPTGAFTNADVGNFLEVLTGPSAGRYLIEARISATQVRIQSFVDVTPGVGLDWRITTGTLPKRHKAAFVILDKVLKHQMFQVTFDSATLANLNVTLVTDLQELVFVAKPAYTYIALSPTSLFSEVIRLTETLDRTITLGLGGGAGEIIAANENPLLVIGASWLIGNWYRYAQNTTTFVAPAASITNTLGVTPVNYTHHVSKLVLTPGDYTTGAGEDIQAGELVLTAAISPIIGAQIYLDLGETYITVAAAPFVDSDIGHYVIITGSGLGNNGPHRIGAVVSATTVRVDFPTAVAESGLTYQIASTGSSTGQVVVGPQGTVTFEDLTGRHLFAGSHVGDQIRRPYTLDVRNQMFPIHEVLGPAKVSIAVERRVSPIAGVGDVDVAVSGGVATVVNPGDLIFSMSYALTSRMAQNLATSKRRQFFLEFTGPGPNIGQRFFIGTYLGPSSCTLIGAVADTAAQQCYLGVIDAPDVIPEISDWEHVHDSFTVSGNTVTLQPIAVPNPAVVNYTAYGVLEPTDPTVPAINLALGDTPYHIGMVDPRQHRTRSRTGRDTDLREDPVQITVT